MNTPAIVAVCMLIAVYLVLVIIDTRGKFK